MLVDIPIDDIYIPYNEMFYKDCRPFLFHPDTVKINIADLKLSQQILQRMKNIHDFFRRESVERSNRGFKTNWFKPVSERLGIEIGKWKMKLDYSYTLHVRKSEGALITKFSFVGRMHRKSTVVIKDSPHWEIRLDNKAFFIEYPSVPYTILNLDLDNIQRSSHIMPFQTAYELLKRSFGKNMLECVSNNLYLFITNRI